MTRLDDVKARAAAATPGPWRYHGQGPAHPEVFVIRAGTPYISGRVYGNADATFIAHSRDDIDWLIARVEELSAAEADAAALAAYGNHSATCDEYVFSLRHVLTGLPPARERPPCSCGWGDALSAHEARAALRNLEAEQ